MRLNDDGILTLVLKMRRRILSIRVDSEEVDENLHRCAFKPALKRPGLGQGTLRGHRESMDSLSRAPGPAKVLSSGSRATGMRACSQFKLPWC